MERYRDIGVLLRPRLRAEYEAMDSAGRRDLERMFFTVADPVHLTDVEERRMEHYSRAAWADLRFDARAADVKGMDTDRGLVHVRLGEPDDWRQSHSEGSGAGYTSGSDSIRPGETLFLGSFTVRPLPVRVLWLYQPREDDRFAGREHISAMLRFNREAGRRSARLENLQTLNNLPTDFYRPRTITGVASYAHQVARFRGGEPHLSRIEVYGRPPLRALRTGPGDGLDVGFFLYDRAWHLGFQDRQAVPVRDTVLNVTYRIEVHPGLYYYSLEARETAPDSLPRPLARARLGVLAEEYPRDRVSLSDLLIADEITPRVPSVTRRDELVIEPSRTLVFRPGDPVSLYFEVYGLVPDRDGWGHYRAEVVVSDSANRSLGLVERLTRGVQELFRRGTDSVTRQSWERTVQLDRQDDRVADYLTVGLPELRPGVYRARIKVTDLRNGSTAQRVRDFIVSAALPEMVSTPPVWFDVDAVLLDAIRHTRREPPQPRDDPER